MDNTTLNTFSDRSKGVSAKDFFLHLGMIVSLYVVAGSFITLLFRVINRAFPEVITNGYYWSMGSEISMPVATLVIVFPIFILLTKFVYASYETFPEKKNLGVHKWLTYITLFVAGIILAGDLVTVLYKFLDGQDLTSAFLLKALTVFLVAGGVFGFYLQDIRDRVSSKERRVWFITSTFVVLLSIVIGFSVLGTPRTQRMLRLDQEKIAELQNIEWQVINYWQVNGLIPEMMPDLKEGFSYKKTGDLNFELCATFNRSSFRAGRRGMMAGNGYMRGGMYGYGNQNDWSHNAGYHCFDLKIDPIAYPTQIKG